MSPILFSFGKIHFYSYGFFASLAFIAGYLVVYKLFPFQGKKPADLLDKCLMVFLLAIIVSRLSYFILYHQQFDPWWEVFYIWQGGLTSYGGFVGGLLAYSWYFRKNLRTNLDILAIAFLAGLFWWRIGCTLSGDHPTLASQAWYAINGHLPVPLWESLSGLAGFLLTLGLYKRAILQAGYIFALVVIYYGLIRLVIDHWRIDPMIGSLTTGQFSGIIMAILGIIALLNMIVYDKKRKREA